MGGNGIGGMWNTCSSSTVQLVLGAGMGGVDRIEHRRQLVGVDAAHVHRDVRALAAVAVMTPGQSVALLMVVTPSWATPMSARARAKRAAAR